MKLNDAKWSDLKSEMRQIMIDVAHAGQTISYSELCVSLKTAYLHHRSPMLTQLLIEIGTAEARAGRPPLPAVVVAKQSGMPGGGYFKIDREPAVDLAN